MATIGHSLVGLSLAGMSRAASRGNALRFVWPGFMVLMGHVVDVIEWVTVLLFANWADGHYVTHSPFVTIGFVAVICAMVAIFGRLRRPWPYILIAACVFSHLAMDAIWGRKALADLYGVMPEGLEGYSFKDTIVAECWFYGLILLLVLLARGVIGVSKLSRSPTVKGGAVAIHVVWSRPPRPARIAAGFFAALALLAAGTRMAAIWIPVYVIGFLHAALLLRREIDIRLAWGGLYLVPLVICVVSEIHASNLGHEAWALQMDKDYRGAIGFYHRSLSYPQRASPVYPLLHIGQCYDALGEPDHAETYFKKAAAVSEEPGWGQYWLAWFYANRNWEKAGFYKPKEAAKILQSLVKSDAREAVRKTAAGLLDDLAHREGS